MEGRTPGPAADARIALASIGFVRHDWRGAQGAAGQMAFLDVLAARVGLDPFEYLLVTIAGIVVWTWCSVITDVAITGRGVWLRWGSIALAAFGAVMFATTARLLE